MHLLTSMHILLANERYPSTIRSVGGEKSCTTFARKLYNIQSKVVQLSHDLNARPNQRHRTTHEKTTQSYAQCNEKICEVMR